MSNLPPLYQFHRLLTLFLLGLVLGVPLSSTWGQTENRHSIDIDIRFYGIEHGLTSNRVTCLFKDRQGIMWVGTAGGLHFFDGKKFQFFPLDTTGIRREIASIHPDQLGRMWVFSNAPHKEMFCIDPTSNQSSLYKDIYPKSNVSPQEIQKLIGNEAGDIILMTPASEFYELDTKDGFSRLPIPFKGQPLNFTYVDRLHHIWIHYADKDSSTLHQVSKQGEILQTYRFSAFPEMVPQLENSQSDEFWWSFSWFEDFHYIESKNGKIGTKLRLGATDHWDYPLFIRAEDSLILRAGPQQFQIWHISGNRLFDWEAEFGEPSPLITFLRFGHFDDQGLFWGGGSSGLYCIKIEEKPFTKLMYLPRVEDDLGAFLSCRGILKDRRGTLYVQSYRQSYQFHNGERIPYPPQIQERMPHSLLEDRNGNIWIGKMYTLSRINSKDGSIREFDLDTRWGAYFSEIWSLYEDEEGKIWLGGEDAFGSYNPQTDSLSLLWNENTLQTKENPCPKGIYQIFQDHSGNLWLATREGLFAFDSESQHLTRYSALDTGKNYLPAFDFRHIHQDVQGDYWFATYGGLVYWDSTRTHFQHVPLSDSQYETPLHAIYEDDRQNLWMSSDRGLIRYHKPSGNYRLFTEKDGITHPEFNRISHFQDKEGYLYFGGLNGVTVFHPEEVIQYEKLQTEQYPLEISEYTQFSTKTGQMEDRKAELLQAGKVILNPEEDIFRLTFIHTDYIQNPSVYFQYRFLRQPKNWTQTQENFIQVNNLRYGRDTLEIQAILPGRLTTGAVLKIPIEIVRPFYLSFWFFVLSSLTGASLCFAFFRKRTLQLKEQKKYLEIEIEKSTDQIRKDKTEIERQAKELKSLDKLKTQFFINVSHELRTPLTLILGPLDLLAKNLTGKEGSLARTAKENGEQILGLVEQILLLSKLEQGKLVVNESVLPLHQVLAGTINSFSHLANLNQLELLFHADFPPNLLVMIDREKITTILKNLIINAIKATPPRGSIEVKSSIEGEQIIISVEDNGFGIPREDLPSIFNRYFQSHIPHRIQGGTGIGLSISYEYAKLLNGDLRVESELSKGSCFELTFPLKPVEGESFISEPLFSVPDLDLEEAQPMPPHSASAFTLLIVEDHPSLHHYIQLCLGEGYHYLTALNGKAGLELLKSRAQQNKPGVDLIISDIMMPKMDGFELLERLKSSEQYRHIPTIILTARASIQDKLRLLRIGVDDYLIKPFIADELSARVQNLLSHAHERKKHLEIEENGSDPRLSASDQQWLMKAEGYLKRHIGNSGFKIGDFAEAMAMSERQLNRKVKALTGLSPGRYMREIKLVFAHDLLIKGEYRSIAEVCQKAGFPTPNYFSKLFKDRFGKLPSELHYQPE